jgi:glycosyltransferase involved in cell wall biosynthesis
MAGLFVQKHADAVRAQGVDVRVIHSLSLRDTWHQWKALQREGWMPDLVQLNVIQKQGLLALWLKRRYGIPYVIIEHWTGYLPQNMSVQPHGWHSRFMKNICRNAEVVMPVSNQLMQAMQALGFQAKQWEKIDNVVDDFFFRQKTASLKDKRQKTKTLLNITCFDEPHKNVKGLLRAAKMLSEKRQDWKLVLVGTGVDYEDVRAYAESLDFPEGLLEWTGELPPREVAERMHKADAFVLSSRYETYGVVLAEAAAAGLPILSTPVGIAEELPALIVPQEIAQNKPGRFAEFMESVLWNQESGVRNQDYTDRFSAEAIGKKLKTIYEQCTDLESA